MTRPRLPINPALVSPGRRGRGAGEPAPHPVPSPSEQASADQANAGVAAGELLITVEEAARRLAVGRSHLYRYLQCGQIRSIRLGRSRRVAVEDLAAFINEHRSTDAR